MKSHGPNDAEKIDRDNCSKSLKIRKKNMKRLGGAGLSLEAFANAKSKSSHYNPALINKQREFYKNAKYVKKYKKVQKQQRPQTDASLSTAPIEGENGTGDGSKVHKKDRKKKNRNSLNELYEKKREEEEKARMEREAIIQAKKEEREKAETRRKATREKMFKKTRYGQPVMKYRIERLLQSIQNTT